MNHDFLMKEYELCFEQLRFYDSRHSDILKFLFTLTSAVATAQFAIYKFFKTPTKGFFMCQTFLSSIVFIASALLFLSMLQNRLYFVYITRQINAIRKFFLETEAHEFKDNQLYTSTDFPAFKPFSVHIFQLLGAALISSLFAGVSAYSVYPALDRPPCWWFAATVFLLVALVEVIVGITYLALLGQKTADEAIHGKSRKSS
jgi:hypothetical protein